ncbi:hypothetical protein [Isoptericola sp. NPDC056605]|uniref:hypothetical protein n=1 Tax=Isoptericola sp. NPDC056605 TaxID=3345876 RepID=UPI00369AD59F
MQWSRLSDALIWLASVLAVAAAMLLAMIVLMAAGGSLPTWAYLSILGIVGVSAGLITFLTLRRTLGRR